MRNKVTIDILGKPDNCCHKLISIRIARSGPDDGFMASYRPDEFQIVLPIMDASDLSTKLEQALQEAGEQHLEADAMIHDAIRAGEADLARERQGEGMPSTTDVRTGTSIIKSCTKILLEEVNKLSEAQRDTSSNR